MSEPEDHITCCSVCCQMFSPSMLVEKTCPTCWKQRAEKAEAELAKEGAEWACVDCGYSDDGFITVENKCYAEPTDYDIECPECHSRNTTEGRANALTEIARKLQQAEKERDQLRADAGWFENEFCYPCKAQQALAAKGETK